MAEPFRDIAQKLAGTLVPSPVPAQFQELGQAAVGGVQEAITPFREAEKKDIIAGEYAASPYRMHLAQLTGRKDWSDLAKSFETKRNELLTWKPAGEKIKRPKMQTVQTDFNQDFLNNMKPGESVNVGDIFIRRRSDGKFAYQTPREKQLGVMGLSEAGVDIMKNVKTGTKVSVEQPIPGEFEEVEVNPEGKSKKDIQKEMKRLRAEINRVIPSKSELERVVERYRLEIAGGRPAGVSADKWAMEKYKAGERYINLIQSADKDTMAKLQEMAGDIPFNSIRRYFTSYLGNMNNNLTIPAIRDGKFRNVDNSTLNTLQLLDEPLVDRHIQGFRDSINQNIQAINAMDKESDKLLGAYSLLMQIAPTAGDPVEAVNAAVGRQMLLETLGKAEINPNTDLEGGIMSLPRYQDDYNNMAKVVLNERSKNFKTPIANKGQNLFTEAVKTIRKNIPQAKLPRDMWIFGKGTKPENIVDRVRNNLIADPNLSKFAPVTREAWENPTETQKKWLALFRAAYGRDATFEDIRKVQSVERVQAEKMERWLAEPD